MPVVEFPNGDRIDFPDGTPDAVVQRVSREHWQKAAGAGEQKKSGIGKFFGDLNATTLDAMSLGFSDEVGAAAEAGVKALARATGSAPNAPKGDFSSDYAAALAENRQRLADTGVPAQLGGAVLAAPSALVAGPGLGFTAPKLAASIGAGAANAGVYGFGSGEGDMGARVAKAAGEAPVGAISGLAAQAGGTALGKAAMATGSRLAPRVLGAPEDQYGLDRISRALGLDDVTPAQAQATAGGLGKEAMLADTGGENLLGAARSAAGVPGPAKNLARQRLDERAIAQGERINTLVDDVLSSKDFAATRSKIISDRAQQAVAAYEWAGVPADPAQWGKAPVFQSSEISELLKNKHVGRVISQARTDNPNLAGVQDNSMVLLDKAYKRIGEEAANLRSTLNSQGKSMTRANDLDALRTRLREAIVAVNPPYEDALQGFADQTALKTALETGEKYAKAEANVTSDFVAKLSAPEKEMFVTGVAKAITDTSGAIKDRQNAALRLFGTPKARERLQAAFPDAASFETFSQRMLAENRMSRTREFVQGGSNTADKLAEQQAQSGIAGDLGAAALGSKYAIVDIARKMAGMDSGPTRDEQRALADMLFRSDPATIERVLNQIRTRAAATSALDATGRALVPGAAIGAGMYMDGSR